MPPRRRQSGGGGTTAVAKYFLLVWAVALAALVVLHERSIAEEPAAPDERDRTHEHSMVATLSPQVATRELHRMFATPPPRAAIPFERPTAPPRTTPQRGPSCTTTVASMRYWTSGETHASPYARYGPTRKYLTFEPDAGGWNNIRMAFETLAVLAHATGRVLVMPPPQRLYLLKVTHAGNTRAHHGVDAFLDFEALREVLEVIDTPQFLNETVSDAGTRRHLLDVTDRASHGGIKARRELREWMRNNADVEPRWAPLKECVAFGPCAQKDEPYRRLTADEFCTRTRRVRFLDQRFAGAPWVHATTNASQGYRMFTHWYTFLLFDDGVTDLYYKRFVRDRLKYKDDVFCTAGKIVDALTQKALALTGRGTYQAAHIRRGELQFLSVRISPEALRDALLSFGYAREEALFILTDEKDTSWFAPLEATFAKIYYLHDFADELTDLTDPNAFGMVEQIIASATPCRLFTGTFFSTFSGYVARLRAYYGHAADTFFYAAPAAKHRVLHDTSDKVHAPFYNREWALAWNNLDVPPVDRLAPRALPLFVNVTDVAARREVYPKNMAARIKAADARIKAADAQPARRAFRPLP